ncbi:hypothetical protein [Streptomyces sp. NPDC021622]|uniref:hypothetical protein n=1 Tax=Streptomyces sp. NPDC021622 TaxID=3155013 RepID=UPI00340AB461
MGRRRTRKPWAAAAEPVGSGPVSIPGTYGSGTSTTPCRKKTSAKLAPAYATSIATCPGPGSGVLTSARRSTSAVPNSGMVMDCMVCMVCVLFVVINIVHEPSGG